MEMHEFDSLPNQHDSSHYTESRLSFETCTFEDCFLFPSSGVSSSAGATRPRLILRAESA
jgi:hypothetical protein